MDELQGVVFVGTHKQPPSSFDILAAIRELGVDHFPGVLIIIKDTTHQRLTFNLAVDKALAQNIKVKLLLVDDDRFANRLNHVDSKLGSTGVIFILKIAGAMAEAGESLDKIFSYCQTINDENLWTCNIRLNYLLEYDESGMSYTANFKYEIGVGLKVANTLQVGVIKTTNELVDIILSGVWMHPSDSNVDSGKKESIVLMVNNFGSLTEAEIRLLTMAILSRLKDSNLNVQRIYCGNFFTSASLRGFSLTFLKVWDAKLFTYLDAPTAVVAWNEKYISADMSQPEDDLKDEFDLEVTPSYMIRSRLRKYTEEEEEQESVKSFGPSFSRKSSEVIRTVLTFVCDALISCEKQMNYMDVDGDSGYHIAHICKLIKFNLLQNKIDLYQPGKLFYDLAEITEQNMMGSLGAIYSMAFIKATNICMSKDEDGPINCRLWLDILDAVIKEIEIKGRIKLGDKTILDGIHGAWYNLNANYTDNLIVMAQVLAEGAEMGTSNTMTAFASQKGPTLTTGLSSPDPGAHSVAVCMRAIFEGMKSKLT